MIPSFLEKVQITAWQPGGRPIQELVRIPSGLKRCYWFYGTNIKSKGVDVLCAVPVEPITNNVGCFNLYRWSAKHNKWNSIYNIRGKLEEAAVDDGFFYAQRYRRTFSLLSIADYETVPKSTEFSPTINTNLPPITNLTTCGIIPGAPLKKEKTMNLNKIFGRFGKTAKGDFAVSLNGSVAVKRKDGSFACLEGEQLVNVDEFAFDIDAFFYLPTTPDQLATGDVIVTGRLAEEGGVGGGVGFVVNVDKGNIKVYDVNSESFHCIRPATHFLLRTSFVTKVFSPISGTDGGGMGSLALMALLGKGKDMGGLLPLMLLGSQSLQKEGGDTSGMNPLMLLLLLGKDKDGKGKDMEDLLPLMLLGGGLNSGGASGMNPLMLPLLLGKDKDGGDKSDLFTLLALSGGLGGLNNTPADNQASGGSVINPMLLFFLLKDSDDSGLLPLMLMGGGGFGGAANPISSIFGGGKPAAHGHACCRDKKHTDAHQGSDEHVAG